MRPRAHFSSASSQRLSANREQRQRNFTESNANKRLPSITTQTFHKAPLIKRSSSLMPKKVIVLNYLCVYNLSHVITHHHKVMAVMSPVDISWTWQPKIDNKVNIDQYRCLLHISVHPFLLFFSITTKIPQNASVYIYFIFYFFFTPSHLSFAEHLNINDMTFNLLSDPLHMNH